LVPKWRQGSKLPATQHIAAPAQTGGAAMTIHSIFADQAFGPEDLKNMSQAYEAVCEALELKVKADMVTETVAERIIEFAERGVRDTASLTEMTLQAFNVKT
jgi:hypothetical protein